MHLTPGTRLGPYEIVAPLGAGGMGEVFRARDVRLDREVAIKSLPAAFAQDAERLARFDREAKLLASLSHPNIAAIFGLEDADGTPFLVLELVEGESLAQRLVRGPLALRETLDVAAQVAAAIEAAHERGIVHRDLKPGNVMLAPSRMVKVLDFGLARGGAAEAVSTPGAGANATMAGPLTGAGLILGTTAYMSPEQARGQAVDRRADVWAFGCLVYECLTGQSAFGGGTSSDMIGRILEREPDWRALPPGAPPRLKDVLRRCLTKNVDDRPRDIGDLHREFDAIARELSTAPAAPASGIASLPSLAVLYFENLANDAESEYFCAGITEDILTDLSKIRGLRVASRNAVTRYRGGPADIPKVAAELGVAAVLEGSVRRAGGRVRITAQLINAADGFHLWAERYDRTLEDVFAVQEEIAAAIAGALEVALAPAEAAKIAADRPDDVRAYDLYLKGRARYGAYTAESLQEAADLFRQAIAIDPNYARAWAGVADCCGQMLLWGNSALPREEVQRRGIEAAHKAIELSPRLPDGYKAEALVRGANGDDAGARALLHKALEADPRYSPAILNLAVDAYCHADLAAAERFMRRALEIDPQECGALTWLALLTLVTLRIDEALALVRRTRAASSEVFYVTFACSLEVSLRLVAGDFAAAEAAVQAGIAAGANADTMRAVGAHVAARSGRVDEARQALDALENAPGLGVGALVSLAAVAVRLGELERAGRLLQRPIVLGMAGIEARLEPDLHPLLDLPPLAPRRLDATLVWPLEAPMIDRARFRLFREVRIESGLPEGTDVR